MVLTVKRNLFLPKKPGVGEQGVAAALLGHTGRLSSRPRDQGQNRALGESQRHQQWPPGPSVGHHRDRAASSARDPGAWHREVPSGNANRSACPRPLV